MKTIREDIDWLHIKLQHLDAETERGKWKEAISTLSLMKSYIDFWYGELQKKIEKGGDE